MYQEATAYPVFDRDYEAVVISEATADRRDTMEAQTVTEAAGLSWTIAEQLDYLAWLLTGDDEAGAAVRRYGCMTLEEFKDQCRASDPEGLSEIPAVRRIHGAFPQVPSSCLLQPGHRSHAGRLLEPQPSPFKTCGLSLALVGPAAGGVESACPPPAAN